jgi:hypothetical protein
MQQNVWHFVYWPGSLMERPAPYGITGAKSEGLSQLAHLWGNNLWPFKGTGSGNFAKRVMSVDFQNKTHALISSCLNVVRYVKNILHGFPYTYVEVHKILLHFLFWSFILRLHFVMHPLNVLSSCHCKGPGQLSQYSGLADGRSVVDSIRGRYFSLLHDIAIGSDDPVQRRATVFFIGGGVRWQGHKADWVPRLSTDTPHVFRMCPWLVVGTVLLCVCMCVFAGANSVKLTGTEFCPVKVWKKDSEIFFTISCRIC